MERVALCVGFLLIITCYVGAQAPTYAVIVPKLLRPGQEFDVCVIIYDSASSDVSVTAKLTSTSDDSELVSGSKSVSPGSQKMIKLSIPNSGLQNEYMFTVEGSGGEEFTNDTVIKTSFKTLIILIQTDKAIYQAGETVMYRVMAVKPNLLPYCEPFEIAIFDPAENKLNEVNEADTTARDCDCVYSGDMQLPDEPALGDWKISVKANTGAVEEKTFKVDEYVLPLFEVTVEGPSMLFVGVKDQEVVITIKATYNYGKGVAGKAVIEYYLDRYNPVGGFDKIKKTIDIDGEYVLTLTEEDLLALYDCKNCELDQYPYAYSTLIVDVKVTDSVSEETMSGKITVPFKTQLFEIKFLENTPKTFKDGLTWVGYATVKRADGTPLKADDLVDGKGKKLKVKVRYNYNTWLLGKELELPDEVSEEMNVPSDGLLVISHDVAAGFKELSITVSYPSEGESKSGGTTVYAYEYLDKALSRDNQGIQIKAEGLTGPIQPSDDALKFTVKSSESISKYWYKILSKGMIVHQGQESASGTENQFEVTFDSELAQKASPTARIVIWYVTAGGEVIVDSLELSVDGAFVNQLSMSYDKSEVEPGESVTLTVETEPRACVGILAVDTAVLALATGNDITEEDVTSGLTQFDSNLNPYYPPFWRGKRKKRSFWWPVYNQGKAAKEVLENAGVYMLTDALVYEEPRPDYPYYYPEIAFGAGAYDDDGVDVMEDGNDESRNTKEMDDDSSTSEDPKDEVRKLFPESWIWILTDIGANGKVVLTEEAPDSITTWITTAFSLSKNKGIGFSPAPAELVVFKSCFAEIRLPAVAVRNEVLELDILVFNYLDSKQTITVKLQKAENDAFYAAGLDGEPKKAKALEEEIMVGPGEGQEVKFTIKPVTIGDLPVEVRIKSDECSDALVKPLNVEPEGERHDESFAILFTLEPEDGEVTETVNINFPEDVVPDSQRIQVTAIGDIMGPSISNLDRLIKIPYGCGEQNMVTFAPNIYAMDYLEATGGGTTEQKANAIKNMEKGYAQQNNWKLNDGSYSAFGQRDGVGSTWLTAFVLRCFTQASKYITIDSKILAEGVDFLLKNQKKDGSFSEPGTVIHKAMQGRASGGIPLTAYIAKVLHEVRDKLDKSQKNKVDSALTSVEEYLKGELNGQKDKAYSLGLICYFLCAVDSNKAGKCLEYFEDLATNTGGSMYWELESPSTKEYAMYYRPPSNNVETTSYGLLIYVLKEDYAKGALVTKWLSTKRSSLGGYGSTQDTVIGLQALSAYAMAVRIPDGSSVEVQFPWDSQVHKFDTITNQNADVLQQKDIPDADQVKQVKITAKGEGTALVQVNIFYNKAVAEKPSGYDLTVTSVDHGTHITITACVTYDLEESGMSILDLEMLTGYEPEMSGLVVKYEAIGMKKATFKDKFLNLYFDLFDEEERCVEFNVKRIYMVKNVQPAEAMVYDYYQTDNRASVLYSPKDITKCKNDKKWKEIIEVDGMKCKVTKKGKSRKCSCNDLRKKKRLLRKACKQNIKDAKTACCKACKKFD